MPSQSRVGPHRCRVTRRKRGSDVAVRQIDDGRPGNQARRIRRELHRSAARANRAPGHCRHRLGAPRRPRPGLRGRADRGGGRGPRRRGDEAALRPVQHPRAHHGQAPRRRRLAGPGRRGDPGAVRAGHRLDQRAAARPRRRADGRPAGGSHRLPARHRVRGSQRAATGRPHHRPSPRAPVRLHAGRPRQLGHAVLERPVDPRGAEAARLRRVAGPLQPGHPLALPDPARPGARHRRLPVGPPARQRPRRRRAGHGDRRARRLPPLREGPRDRPRRRRRRGAVRRAGPSGLVGVQRDEPLPQPRRAARGGAPARRPAPRASSRSRPTRASSSWAT